MRLLLLQLLVVVWTVSASVAPTGLVESPSPSQTRNPSSAPTSATSRPTALPTRPPSTEHPTALPSEAPLTPRPTASPTKIPTLTPTTASPTRTPTLTPITSLPSRGPTHSPTKSTNAPSASPVHQPTRLPTVAVTSTPSSQIPSTSPTFSLPTKSPTLVTLLPTNSPTRKTSSPSRTSPSLPSRAPTPTKRPTSSFPSLAPTLVRITRTPTLPPTSQSPSESPSASPSFSPPPVEPTPSPFSVITTPTPYPSQRIEDPTTDITPSSRPTVKPTSGPTVKGATREPSASPSRSGLTGNSSLPNTENTVEESCGGICTGLGVTFAFALIATIGMAVVLYFKVKSSKLDGAGQGAFRGGRKSGPRVTWDDITESTRSIYRKAKLSIGAFLSQVIPQTGSPKLPTPEKPEMTSMDNIALPAPLNNDIPAKDGAIHSSASMQPNRDTLEQLRSAGLVADQSFQLRNERARVHRLENQVAQIEKDNQALHEQTRRLKEEASVLAGLSGDMV